ncbi:hypothetical protein GCM10027262_78220 [Nocardia tengchongensis]
MQETGVVPRALLAPLFRSAVVVGFPLRLACSGAITRPSGIKGAYGVGKPMAQAPPSTPDARVIETPQAKRRGNPTTPDPRSTPGDCGPRAAHGGAAPGPLLSARPGLHREGPARARRFVGLPQLYNAGSRVGDGRCVSGLRIATRAPRFIRSDVSVALDTLSGTNWNLLRGNVIQDEWSVFSGAHRRSRGRRSDPDRSM